MEAQARAKRAFQEMTDHSVDVICTFDAEGRFLQVSRACEALWGYSPEELIGHPYREMVLPEDREKTMPGDQSVLSGDSATGLQNRHLRKDGSVVWIVWIANWSAAIQVTVWVAHDIYGAQEDGDGT